MFRKAYQVPFLNLWYDLTWDLNPGLPDHWWTLYSLYLCHGCKALCIVITILILWSLCLSSSFVYVKKGPENLTRGTAQALTFLLQTLIREVFLFFWDTLSLLFSSFPVCLIVSAFDIPWYLLFSFFPRVMIVSWFGSSIPSFVSLLTLFINNVAHF